MTLATAQLVTENTGTPDRAPQRRAEPHSGDLAGALRNIEADLAGISTATESVFLLTGERLMALQVRASEIAVRTSGIAEILADDQGAQAILDEVLSSSQTQFQTNDLNASTQELRENANAVRHAIEAFGSVATVFYALGVKTRIESAHSERVGATFEDLANSVIRLSRQIQEQIGTISDSAAILLETTTQGADEVRRVARNHQENLGSLGSEATAQLSKIRDHRGHVAEAAKRLASRFDKISRAVADVVIALQSHDIVRQQVEHVLESLRRFGPDGSADLNFADIAAVQAAQLDHSRATFENSVKQIRHALVQIESNIGEVEKESAHLLGLSGASEASYLSNIRSHLASILGIVNSNAAAEHRLAEATASVDVRVAEITPKIGGLDTISIHMQHLALNATIQAVGLAQDGVVFKIVADTIRENAKEAEATFDSLEKRLSRMRDSASSLRQMIAARGGLEEQAAQLRLSIDLLSSVQDEAHEGYTRTVELTAWLKQHISETIGTFGTQQNSMEILSAASEMLREISADASLNGAADADRLTSIYTMQSERDVHQTLYANFDKGLPLAYATTGPQEGNVEFF
jgi:DNA repair exonuclease SbcCD ATPase subunit